MDGKGWLLQGLQNYQKTVVEQVRAILLFGDSSNSLLRLSAWHIVTGNLFPNPDMLQKNQQKGTKYISIQHSPSNPNMCVLFGQVFLSQHHESWHTSFPPWTKSQAASPPSWGTKDLSDSLHMEIKQLFTGHKLTLELVKYMQIYICIYTDLNIYAYVWLYRCIKLRPRLFSMKQITIQNAIRF